MREDQSRPDQSRNLSFPEALERTAVRSKGVRAYWYTERINRPAARIVAAILATWNVSPNAVTWTSFALTFAGLAIAASVGYSVIAATGAYLLLVCAYVLDSADGQLARILDRSSLRGEWLDHVLDHAKHVLFHGALLVGVLTVDTPQVDTRAFVMLVVVAATAHTTAYTAFVLFEQVQRQLGAAARKRSRDRSLGPIVFFAYDWGILILLVLLLPFTALFTLVYAGVAVYLVGVAFAKGGRMYVALSAPWGSGNGDRA